MPSTFYLLGQKNREGELFFFLTVLEIILGNVIRGDKNNKVEFSSVCKKQERK